MIVFEAHYYGCSPHESELCLSEAEWARLKVVKGRITVYGNDGHKYVIRKATKRDRREAGEDEL